MTIPGLVVLAEGPGWVAVDKPAGLLSVPGRGPDKADCVLARARTRYPEAEAPHRLDMDTSGVLLVATDKGAMRFISRGFQRRKQDKTYVAVVAGHVPDDEGVIDLPMRRDWENRPYSIVADDGKPSQTRYRVVHRTHDAPLATHLELVPVTGRTHQLRVHLAAIGFPILGDILYGPAGGADAPRLMLHAMSLTFVCPSDEQPRTVAAPIPFAFGPG